MTFIIDVPLSLTDCSGRDRQRVVVKWRERWRHISSMISDVPLSLTSCSGRGETKCGSEVEGKMISSIIDMPLSLTNCSGRDRQSVVVKWRER